MGSKSSFGSSVWVIIGTLSASIADCSPPSSSEKPPTMAKSLAAMFWASLATVPEEKALSIPFSISLRPFTPPSLLIIAK